MTKEDLAGMLNGREYGSEITEAEDAAAREAGLVVVFGASDDLMEFRGSIHDESGAYCGEEAYITREGMFEECDEECKYSKAAKDQAKCIKAVWRDEMSLTEPTWSYKTDIPHATFLIYEEGTQYCRGIVFDLASLE